MPYTTHIPDAQYRNSAIQDMLGRPPGWLLHSGLTVIAVAVAVIIGLSAVIRYPERVEAPFILQTETVPLSVNAGAGNYLEAVLVEDRAAVTSGDTLIVFRSDGDWRTVKQLTTYLSAAISVSQLDPVPLFDYPSRITPSVAQVNATLRAYASYRLTNGVAAQITALHREIDQAGALSGSLSRQVALYDEELAYKNSNVERARTMHRDSLISTQEAEAFEEQTISAYRQREALVAGDAQNQLRMNQLDQEILRLELDDRERRAEFERQLAQQLQLIQAAVDEFSSQYFIMAREAGTIDWLPEVREGALVQSGGHLGFIIPGDASDRKVARLRLPAAGEGRVTVGDKVILELDAYPSREFGQLIGELVTIDLVALPDAEQRYGREATVLLPDRLVSSYDRPLQFQYNLTGTARIITADRTLLQRLLDQFFNLTQNR